jgi:hypothetical protein
MINTIGVIMMFGGYYKKYTQIMKGIIVDYFEDKGFGFIKDENQDRRFFHIKSIKERDKFLNNLTDYYYTDWVERICYVVNFTPSQNEKGLNALDIILTKQIFNDNSIKTEFPAIVIDLKYDTDSLTKIMSGITKDKSAPLGATAGSNGTYRIGYPEVSRELNIYFRRIDEIGWGTIDVRELVLTLNDRTKITDSLVFALKNQLMEVNLTIIQELNKWTLKDNSILKI